MFSTSVFFAALRLGLCLNWMVKYLVSAPLIKREKLRLIGMLSIMVVIHLSLKYVYIMWDFCVKKKFLCNVVIELMRAVIYVVIEMCQLVTIIKYTTNLVFLPFNLLSHKSLSVFFHLCFVWLVIMYVLHTFCFIYVQFPQSWLGDHWNAYHSLVLMSRNC